MEASGLLTGVSELSLEVYSSHRSGLFVQSDVSYRSVVSCVTFASVTCFSSQSGCRWPCVAHLCQLSGRLAAQCDHLISESLISLSLLLHRPPNSCLKAVAGIFFAVACSSCVLSL